jgi:uncharacterized pyridoxamine 5'-phosphate oxidase family protein
MKKTTLKKNLTMICLLASLCSGTYYLMSMQQETQNEEGVRTFFKAIEKQNVATVKDILRLNPNLINAVQQDAYDYSYSPLGEAIRNNNKEIVEILLKHTPKPDIEKVSTLEDGTTASALHEAIRKDNNEIVELLLKQNPNLEKVYIDEEGTTTSALDRAIENDNIKIIKLILAQKPDLEKGSSTKKGTSTTPLGKTLRLRDNIEIVKLLLAQKPNLETVYTDENNCRWSALAYALEGKTTKEGLIKLLFEYKPNLEKVITCANGEDQSALSVIIDAPKRDAFIELILRNSSRKSVEQLTNKKIKSLATIKNKDITDFILWIRDGSPQQKITNSKNRDGVYTEAIRFAPIAFVSPAFSKEFEQLVGLLSNEDVAKIFTVQVVRDAIKTQNLKAFEILFNQALKNNSEALIALIDAEITRSKEKETDYTREFLTKLRATLSNFYQAREALKRQQPSISAEVPKPAQEATNNEVKKI